MSASASSKPSSTLRSASISSSSVAVTSEQPLSSSSSSISSPPPAAAAATTSSSSILNHSPALSTPVRYPPALPFRFPSAAKQPPIPHPPHSQDDGLNWSELAEENQNEKAYNSIMHVLRSLDVAGPTSNGLVHARQQKNNLPGIQRGQSNFSSAFSSSSSSSSAISSSPPSPTSASSISPPSSEQKVNFNRTALLPAKFGSTNHISYVSNNRRKPASGKRETSKSSSHSSSSSSRNSNDVDNSDSCSIGSTDSKSSLHVGVGDKFKKSSQYALTPFSSTSTSSSSSSSSSSSFSGSPVSSPTQAVVVAATPSVVTNLWQYLPWTKEHDRDFEREKSRYLSRTKDLETEAANLEVEIGNLAIKRKEKPSPFSEADLLAIFEELVDELTIQEVQSAKKVGVLNDDDTAASLAIANDRNSNRIVCEGFNQEIRVNDCHTLRPGRWLNDEIINFYFELLKERNKANLESDLVPPSARQRCFFHNTFFYSQKLVNPNYNYPAVRRWSKRAKVEMAKDFSKVFVPIHVGKTHWCLAVINFGQKRFEYFDSLGGGDNKCLQHLRQYVRDEAKTYSNIPDYDFSGWEDYVPSDVPHQNNGSDCGVFTCKYADYSSEGLPFTFSCHDMVEFRRRMIREIELKTIL